MVCLFFVHTAAAQSSGQFAAGFGISIFNKPSLFNTIPILRRSIPGPIAWTRANRPRHHSLPHFSSVEDFGKNAEAYVNPELSGGSGLSQVTGIAGFPNGETFRIGNPSPQLTNRPRFHRPAVRFVGLPEQSLKMTQNQTHGNTN